MAKRYSKRGLAFLLVLVMMVSYLGVIPAIAEDGNVDIKNTDTDNEFILEEELVEEVDEEEEEEQPQGDGIEMLGQTLTTYADGAEISISGYLPLGAAVTAVPVNVSIDGVEVLAAYDITIWYDGAEYQPESPVTVTINAPEIEDADQVSIYHMEDEYAQPELVDSDIATPGQSATFTADSFSIYVVTSATGTSGTQATSGTVAVGDTLYLFSTTGTSTTSSNHTWSSGDTSVATVTKNSSSPRHATVTGVAVGPATITHQYRNTSSGSWYSETFEITVTAKSVSYGHIDIKTDAASSTGTDKVSSVSGLTYTNISGGTVTVGLSGGGTNSAEWTSTSRSLSVPETTTIRFTAVINSVSYNVELTKDDVYPANTYYSGDNYKDLVTYGFSYKSGSTNTVDISGANVFLVSTIVCNGSDVTSGKVSGNPGLDLVLNVETIINNATNVIQGTKNLDDAASATAFEFELYQTGSTFDITNATKLQTVSNVANGSFSFSALTFDTAGTYYYVVKEKAGTGDYTYDDTIYRVTVAVTSNTVGKTTTYYAIPSITKVTGTASESASLITFNNYSASGSGDPVGSITDYVVTKVWENGSNSTPPTALTLTLNANGTAVSPQPMQPTPTVSADGKTWTYTYKDLPMFDEDRNIIQYSVVETVPTDYTETKVHTPAVYTPGGASGLGKITPCSDTTFNLEDFVLGYIVVKLTSGGNNWLIWTSVENPSAAELAAVRAAAKAEFSSFNESNCDYIYGSGAKYGGVTIDVANGLVTLTYAASSTWAQFGWGKFGADDYTPASTIITNTYVPPTADVVVTKTWSVDEGITLPENITLELLTNGTALNPQPTQPTPTVSADGKTWTYTYKDLPTQGITYTVRETKIGTEAVTDNRVVVYGTTQVEDSNPAEYNVLGVWVVSITGLDITNTWIPAANTENPGTASFTVQKVDADDDTALGGAVFTLKQDGNIVATQTTDATAGLATFSGLAVGTYTLTETTAPDGYQASTATWTVVVTNDYAILVEVKENGNVFTNIWNWFVKIFVGEGETDELVAGVLTIENTKNEGTATVHGSLSVIKTDGVDQLSGASFAIYDNADCTGTAVHTFTAGNATLSTSDTWLASYLPTTSGGTITLYLKETQAPDGYTGSTTVWPVVITTAISAPVLTDGAFVTTTTYGITVNGSGSLDVVNTRETGSLTIEKVIDGDLSRADFSAEAFTFTVAGPGGYSNTVKLPDADYNWSVTIDNLPTGTYTVTETNAASPAGYTLRTSYSVDKGEATVTSGGNASVIVTNEYEQKVGDDVVNPASFTIFKHENYAPMAGVRFILYKADGTTPVCSGPTDDDGKLIVIIPADVLGTDNSYTFILEETVPDGYEPAGPWTIVVDRDGTITVIDPNDGNDNVFQNVWNWIVSIFVGENEEDQLDANGVLTIENTKIIGEPEDVYGEFTLKKVDEDGNALTGATFSLFDTEYTYDATPLTTYSVGSADISAAQLLAYCDGYATAASGSEWTFYLIETEAPEYYYGSGDPIEIKITKTVGTGYDISKGAYVTTTTYSIDVVLPIYDESMSFDDGVLTVENYREYGSLIISKMFGGSFTSATFPSDEIKILVSSVPAGFDPDDIFGGYENYDADDNTITLSRDNDWEAYFYVPTGSYTFVEDTSTAYVSGYTRTTSYSFVDSYENASSGQSNSAAVTIGYIGYEQPNELTFTNSYSLITQDLPTYYTLTVNWIGINDDGTRTVLRTAEVTYNYSLNDAYATVQHGFEDWAFSGMDTGSASASGTIRGNTVVTYIYTPGTNIGDEDPPLDPGVDIDDGETPLDPGIDIGDDIVPKDDAPRTGESNLSALLAAAMFLSALGAALIVLLPKRKKNRG